MTIFTKPINEITYEDIVSFCEQGIGESVNLDYKRDFPDGKKLAKTISAFANTSGGTILIGVADKDSNPKSPFEGIEHEEKLEERVWNIILDNIYPPVFPEIRVCPPKSNKTFVIIRIPQSNETPHAIYNNTQVYIRTGNRNKPENLATVERIKWLRNRRKKSEGLREMLYRRAEERYQNICESKNVRIEFGEFTLSFAPLYPQKPLISVEEIEIIAEEIGVIDNDYRKFPCIETRLRPVQGGMISFFLNSDNGFICHTEINQFGLVFYKEDLGWLKREKKEGTPPEITEKKLMYMDTLVKIIDVAFESVSKFYKQVGYWGLIEVKFSLERLLGIRFIPLLPRNSFLYREDVPINEIEKQLSWQLVTSAVELNDSISRQKRLLALAKDIAWAFGFRSSEEIIKQRLQERKRWTE